MVLKNKHAKSHSGLVGLVLLKKCLNLRVGIFGVVVDAGVFNVALFIIHDDRRGSRGKGTRLISCVTFALGDFFFFIQGKIRFTGMRIQ